MTDETATNPAHYKDLAPYEPFDVIETWTAANPIFKEKPELGYLYGNILKYMSRFGNKGTAVQDLKKAEVYLSRLIQKLNDEEDFKIRIGKMFPRCNEDNQSELFFIDNTFLGEGALELQYAICRGSINYGDFLKIETPSAIEIGFLLYLGAEEIWLAFSKNRTVIPLEKIGEWEVLAKKTGDVSHDNT